jgi:hypothetical protein
MYDQQGNERSRERKGAIVAMTEGSQSELKCSSFSNFEWYFIRYVTKIEPYIDTLIPFEEEKLKLMGMIFKLNSRNRTLAQTIYLKNFYLFQNIDPD